MRARSYLNLKIGLAIIAVILAVSLIVAYVPNPENDLPFPLIVKIVRHYNNWLNVTFLATADFDEPIIGMQVYYAGQKVSEETFSRVIDLRKDDGLQINLANATIPSGETVEIVFYSSSHHQAFKIIIPQHTQHWISEAISLRKPYPFFYVTLLLLVGSFWKKLLVPTSLLCFNEEKLWREQHDRKAAF